MGFGLNDSDWVDPEEAPQAVCNADCPHFALSPCGECVWCMKIGAFVIAGEACDE